MPRPRPLIPALLVGLAAAAPAQPLTRVAATSLRLDAVPPPTVYSTTRAFAPLSFTQPVALVTPPRETRRLFVVEKTGRIHVIPDVTAAAPTRTLFLDLSARVATGGGSDERGLLALAFHPDYAGNGQFFVWYTLNTTTSAGTGLHDRLARFRVSSGDANVADANSEQPLITQRDEADNHNGGQLLFGPDGYLYLSLGDEGGGNDQLQNSQRIDRDFFAGIIRIDVDQKPGSLAPGPHPAVHAGTYAVPPDNPFVGAQSFNGAPLANPGAVRTEFWATGLRNPWRMSFDPATGRLWCGDVGQNAREEINVIVRGGNYGWNYREGGIAGPRANPPAGGSFIAPVWDYPNPSQGQSVTGGLVYHGTRLPLLAGQYLCADFVSGRLWALRPDGDNGIDPGRVQLLTVDGGISSFGLDPSNGDVLLADLSENTIKRLVATTGGGTPFPATLSATGVFSNVAALTPAAGVVSYAPNVSSWNDHARARHWFALPDTTSRFGFAAEGPWTLPAGAVWAQHFDLELTRGNSATARRVETRLLVKTATGLQALSYRWNDTQTDATLVPEDGADQNFTVVENGATRTQTWRFPARAECLVCHTGAGGFALGFNTRQLNREHAFPGGTANIVAALAQAGYVEPPAAGTALPALARIDDATATLERRARSYLDANCAHCHQPGGTALGSFDARASTPLSLASLLNGALVDNGGDPENRVIVPGDVQHSSVWRRMRTRGAARMPPVATNERDLLGENLLADWITSLAQPQTPARIVNLAARAQVGTDAAALITGFVIAPGANKHVLVRALGPALTPFGVPGVLADPVLTLIGPNSTSVVAGSNDNWSAADADRFSAIGAFTLPGGSRDAAIFAQLAPGAYTAQVSGGTGVALVEVYDADASSTGARLINTSVRAQVGTGANILIPGLVISGGASKTVLIRAAGPALAAAPFGVAGALAEPAIALFAGSQQVAGNTGWTSAPNALQIRDTARAVGAFAFGESSRDSALLVTLSPGAYTIQVSGANNTTGIALVEIYEVN